MFDDPSRTKTTVTSAHKTMTCVAQEHPLVYRDEFSSIEDYCLYLMHVRAYSEALTRVSDKDVLDLGCNNGYGTALLAQKARKVIGLDLSSSAIVDAQRRFSRDNLDFICYDGARLPFSDRSFSAVISFQVIEHIADVELYLSEIRRVLTPDGFVMFTTPNAGIRLDPGMTPWNEFHVTEFRPNQLKAILRSYFSEVTVFGLFADYELYQVEYRRCQTALAFARERAFEQKRRNGLGQLSVWDYLKMTQWRLRNRLKRDPISSSEKTVKPVSSETVKFRSDDYYYSSKKLTRALDLMAICRFSDLTS